MRAEVRNWINRFAAAAEGKPITVNEPGGGSEGGTSRRSFLRRSAVGAALAPGLVLASAARGHAADPTDGSVPFYLQEILNDEVAHVDIISELLMDEDNPLTPKVRRMPRLRNLEQPSLKAFIETAAAFENTGTGTYGGALFAIQQTDEYFPLAAGITTVEARHAGYLNSLLKGPLVPDFFPSDTSIPQSVALSHVDHFIAHLNGDVPSFNPTRASDPNNFLILDFLLLLEYVEAAFYAVNFKKFFPQFA